VASESPATVGDTITYSMTVADVLTATQGAVYMTDNGVTLANCSGPVATNQGSLSYSCDVTYTNVGSHLIVGVFLGDTVYGQSAGQLTEVVQRGVRREQRRVDAAFGIRHWLSNGRPSEKPRVRGGEIAFEARDKCLESVLVSVKEPGFDPRVAAAPRRAL
jgi:hypothetical protein